MLSRNGEERMGSGKGNLKRKYTAVQDIAERDLGIGNGSAK